MSVFDDIERNGIEPKAYAQPDFDYLNLSARPGVQVIRETIDNWFDHYPIDERAELRARLRSEDDYHHKSAFFELFLHELLLRLGCLVEVHPPVLGTPRRPDFLVSSADGHSCYLEAVLALDEGREESAARARMNRVYDAINRLESPDFYIGMTLEGAPATPPSARHIRHFLAHNLAQLHFEEVAELFRLGGFQALPHWEYEHDGWTIVFYPLPKADDVRGRGGLRPIGVQHEPARLLQTRAAIRDAVVQKAGRYGQLGQPYIVAVDVLADHVDRIDITEALFGCEQFQYSREPGRPAWREFGRARNGAWYGRAGVQYTRVSAALVFSYLVPSSVRWADSCVYHNPWAVRPYAGELNRLARAVPRDDRHLDFLDGESVGAILGLPQQWPGA